jgi:glycosyltransferase involved in cell wall biosynthesis
MRILFIIHQFLPEYSSGTERFTMNVAKMHQRNGHRVEVLTCSLGDTALWADQVGGLRRTIVDGLPVYGLPRAFLGNMAEIGVDAGGAATPILTAFFDAGSYDVVHITHSMRMLPAVEIVRDRSIPYVLSLTDFFSICYRINLKRLDGNVCAGPEQGTACNLFCIDKMPTKDLLSARRQRFLSILSGASDVVACSEFVARVFRSDLPDLPVRILEHGIDLRRFQEQRRKRENEQIVFGFIGTLSEAKGVHILVEAFAGAAARNARLELVGPAYNCDFLDRLKTVDSRNITIRDPVDHRAIPEVLGGFDVLCLPSLVPETFSFAQREGFAADLPTLASDIGMPAEIIIATGCGRAVPTGNIEAWRTAIREISDNPELLNSWKKRIPAQARIEEESFFYEQLYRRAIWKRGRISI